MDSISERFKLPASEAVGSWQEVGKKGHGADEERFWLES